MKNGNHRAGRRTKQYMKRISTLLFCLLALLMSAQEEKENDRAVRFAGIPTLDFNQSQGLTVGALGMLFYPLSERDTISPLSISGISLSYTTNKSYHAVGFSKFYLAQDRWRVTVGLGFGETNFQFYQELPILGGFYIPFSTQFSFVGVFPMRRVVKNVYAGLGAWYVYAGTTYKPDFLPEDLSTSRYLNGFAPRVTFDSRDSQLYARKGWNTNASYQVYAEWMGSTISFERLNLDANTYWSLSDSEILAFRGVLLAGIGDVPFEGQSYLGGTDLRGYTNGKYRGDALWAVQSEWRHFPFERLGYVAFLGCAQVQDPEDGWSDLLPSIGGGLRYLMVPEESITVGIEYAWGREDRGIYFRIMEAF